MGAVAIAIWMLVILPLAIIVIGFAASAGLDFAFARINREINADDAESAEPESGS